MKRPRTKEISEINHLENCEYGSFLNRVLEEEFKAMSLKINEIAYFQWFGHFWNTLVLYGIRTGKVILTN